MDWIALCVICMNIVILQARHDFNIKKLIEEIKRRNSLQAWPILGVPQYPEHLPEAEPILPGHTLLRPARGMLKSAIKYPHTHTEGSLVYGNKDNIGIANDKNERVLYTNFRKSDLLTAIANTIKAYKRKHSRPELTIPKAALINYKKKSVFDNVVTHTDEENNAREIIDEFDPERNFFDEEEISEVDFRRKRKTKSKFRDRGNEKLKKVSHKSEDSSSETNSESNSEDEFKTESESQSSSIEHNPGNPYTIHKNKYKQNYMWNHNMDGDHMNINPYAPFFKEEGPSGADLMFGRKWWYFNQDDYKPMG